MLQLSYRAILRMAVPLMASSFIQSVVMITDSSFLSRYSTTAFDAAGNAGMIYITLYVVLMGMSDGSQILMARRVGEKRQDELPKIFGSTLMMNFFLASVLYMLSIIFTSFFLDDIVNNKEIAIAEGDFLRIRSIGIFFSVASLSIIAYLMAIGKTKLVLYSSAIIAVSNIFLDYVLIFGQWNFPKLGLEGAAWASTIADASGMTFLVIAFLNNSEQKKHAIIKRLKAQRKAMLRLLNVSSPIMLQGLVALSTWTTFFIFIEQKGTHELTISQTIRSIYFLAFVPIWGFSSTTKTYISQYIGNKQFKRIPIVQRRIQLLTVTSLVILSHGLVFYPGFLAGLVNPHEAYIEETAEILQFIFASILIFGFISVLFQTIAGSGNTRHSFLVELISVFIYLIVCYLFIKVLDFDIYWIWSVEYIYFISLGILSYLYLRFYNWKDKKI
jgi:MATE family multidrug resistance protein